jgi:hypothetical protein
VGLADKGAAPAAHHAQAQAARRSGRRAHRRRRNAIRRRLGAPWPACAAPCGRCRPS